MIYNASRNQIHDLIARTKGALSPRDMAKLRRCLQFAEILRVGFTRDGEFACAWGLVPPTILSDSAYMWLFVTEALSGHEFTFVRRSQIEVTSLLGDYECIRGHVEAGNVRARRWLQWLGASFGYPTEGLVPFEIRRR